MADRKVQPGRVIEMLIGKTGRKCEVKIFGGSVLMLGCLGMCGNDALRFTMFDNIFLFV